ncbi:hypothetical protein [Mangrovibacter plantisponsor]|uniref:Tail length tape measure protein n=1 Tax=Mangrovibacter plantisponsor TaxID=451513 RepID=A0A317PTL4_9ENTR|nr:hypothetical protein [Mangrovibacter plantisponsor]PWW04984.1 hypothetical protein DES37_11480 [Mangrovibacter plantisponsor]
MAQPNQQLVFNITGNSQGLVQALNQGSNALQQFGRNSGGIFQTFGNGISGITGRLTMLTTGIGGMATAAASSAVAIASLVASSNEYVKTLNDLSKLSGMSVEELQKMDKAFYTSGLNIDQIANANKDALDKWGDAYRNGGGISDDAKELGLNLNNYAKNLNLVDGGLRNIIQSYYELQKLGKTRSEIVNFLESQGSDVSALIPVLQQFKDANEALNYVQSQTANITNDSAAAYQEFDKNMATLETNLKQLQAEGFNPLIKATNDLFSAFEQKPDLSTFDTVYSKLNALQKVTSFFSGFSLDSISQGIIDKSDKNLTNKNTPTVNTLPTQAATVTPSGGFVDKDAEAAKAKAAADKAAAAAKAAEQKRIQAQQQLNAVLGNMGDTAVAAQLAKFDYQQNEMERKIRESAKTLGLSEADTTKYLEAQYKSRSRAFSEMVDQMVSESDPEKLKANLDAIGNRLNPKQTQKVLKDQSDRVSSATGVNNSDNPFSQEYADSIKEQQSTLKDSYTNELGLLEDLNRKKLISVEQYNQKKSAYESAYQRKTLELESQTQIAQMGMISTATSDMATMMAGAFGESSGAAQAFFALSKGVAVATSIIKIQQALSEALATPFPANIAMYAQVLSLGAGIISTIKGTNIQGQAHDGIDSIPNEGTWNLAKGERVLSNPQAKKLDNYLDKNQNASTQPTQQTVINAPLVVQGGSSKDDAQFQAMLKKHANNVNQAVRQSQQRNT